MLERLPVHEAAEGPRGLGNAAREQAADLVQQPALELLVHAPRHTLGRSARRAAASAIGMTSTSGIGDTVSAKCAVSGRPVRKNTSSARTMRFRSRGWMRAADAGSTRRQHAMQERPRRAGPRSPRAAPRSAASRPGPGKQAARQRAVVEPGAADENRQASARVDVADRRRRVARILRRRVLLGRVDDVDQVVRDAAPLGDGTLSVPMSKPR